MSSHHTVIPTDGKNQRSTAETDLDPVSIRTMVEATRVALDAMTPVPRIDQTAVGGVAVADTLVTDIQTV